VNNQTQLDDAKQPQKYQKSILIVEDDDLLRSTMTRYLKRMDYDVQSVVNGFEALLLLQYRQPDLIITDIRMPKLGGLSMAEGLKNRPETKDIPIILVTAYRDETYYSRAQGVGAHFFLMKPFTLSELNSKVETVLKRAHKWPPDNK
jgi:two-component system phosphate regulon response regulator PhoB